MDPMRAPSRRALIDAALHPGSATLVVRDARIVNVFTREILPGDVAVLGDRIIAVGPKLETYAGANAEVLDAAGSYLVPGFIEPHFHAGEPSLSPGDLALALLERGTTTLATDLVEFYAVGGPPAVAWALNELEESGLRTLLLLPLHLLGMERFGTVRHTPTVADFLEMAAWRQTAGINEPPPETVIDQDGGVLEVLDVVLQAPRVFEGHAPALGGARLQAYLAAGASSDHESTNVEDALAKLRLGCRIMMRHCAASQDLRRLVPLVMRYPEAARFFMICSDDMQAKELVVEGHIDHKLRIAIEAGLDPITALQLVTINAAEYFGLAGTLGSIAPGKLADLLLVDSLTELRPSTVIASGTVVARDGRAVAELGKGVAPPDSLRATVEIREPVGAGDFYIPAPQAEGSVQVRVIGIDNGTLLSEALVETLPVIAGGVVPDVDRDILKVAALDRHTASGRAGLAFVHGVGLKHGALATTFTAPHYGLLVVGTTDQEMAAAVTAMRELGGGLAAVRDGAVTAAVEFDVGGFVGSVPLGEMHRQLQSFEQAAAELGCRLIDPLISLASLTIPHIPRYGLSDFGLYDADEQLFVDVLLDP
jgi:adenine deaminase